MAILKDFDSAIAAQEKLEAGFQTEKKCYKGYLSNTAWDTWLKGMKEEHLSQFGKGSGGELEPKNGRPPKMASFASSSRMIYQLSKDIPGFCFEKQLPTKVGGIANLDGYLESENACVFVEAKCREPYGHTEVQVIKWNYKALYLYLQEKMPGNFGCEMEDIPDSRDIRVRFFCKNKPVVYFDIKQMICHMLGIGNELLTSGLHKQILFLYLLYNPSKLQMSAETGAEIMKIYKATCQTAMEYDMKLMFGCILDYLITETKTAISTETAERIKDAFCFVLVDQNTYKNYFSEGHADVSQ